MATTNFNKINLETYKFLCETSETPKIKAGGSSSSNILNRFFTALSSDLNVLATKSNLQNTLIARVTDAASVQSGSLVSTLESIRSRVDAASGYNYVLASMFNSSYLVTPDTTADVDNVYGQATLPVKSTTDLLVFTDGLGRKFVSPELKILYAQKEVYNVNTGFSETDFLEIDDAVYMLTDERTFLIPAGSNPKFTFFRIKTPVQYSYLNPNALDIWPFPAFGMTLRGVWYKEAGGDGTWQDVDISYLANYTTAPSGIARVLNFGPVRVHLPGVPVNEILVAIDSDSSTYVGLHKLKMYHFEYEESAVLKIQDPYSRTIGNVTLQGKDPTTLSQLSVSKSSNTVTVNLSTTDSSATPVITGTLLSV
jgi:hypothetical protein